MIAFGGDIEDMVKKLVTRWVVFNLKELDPDKLYIMVVPDSLNNKELEEALAPIRNKIQLAVIKADNVKLLEIT